MSNGTGFDRIGFEAGQIVQELGWDEDVDEELRQLLMDTVDGDLVEDSLDAVSYTHLTLPTKA